MTSSEQPHRTEQLEPRRSSGPHVGRLFAGLVLTGLGALLLLDQAGTIDARQAIGVVQLIMRPRSPVGPLIVTGIGAILLLAQLDVVPGDVWHRLWPLALIGVGLAVILGWPGRSGPAGVGDELVRLWALFASHEVVSTSQRFRGGAISVIFGSARLDLREAILDPGGATIAVTALFGSVDVLVPRGWRVETSGVPIFAGFNNKTQPALAAEASTLRVDVIAIFGGVDLKHER
jgi:Cell wall-active antibiotics response 4TMS YvqF/Domain of unknown function (DUF5668)